MKLLAFDTATPACSVAVWIDGTVHERAASGQRHAERILLLIDEALAEAGVALNQLDAIAFGRGPGSFTGLRISAGVAQGLAFGADLPVVPVSSLAALAQGMDAPNVLTAFDARMQQVYWGAYVRGVGRIVELKGAETVIAPSQVPVPEGGGWIGAGSGWDQYAGSLQARLGDRLARWHPGRYPQARFLAELGAAGLRAGAAVGPEQALPVYIRDKVAAKVGPPR
jgi:tRNA threonylcarbamoyladenosine biosynthesis protein TsaB